VRVDPTTIARIMRTADRLRRSLLFVPGAEPRKLERAREAGADTLLFDLEDSVAPEAKDQARALVAATLRDGSFGDAEPAVRINPFGSPYFEADVEAMVEAGCRTILLPKCQNRRGVSRTSEALDTVEARLTIVGNQSVRILALIESARGVKRAFELAERSSRMDALCFGHADFCLDMGLPVADASAGVTLYARCEVAISARAAGITPIDTVHLAVKDGAAFREDALLGRRLGFDGKLCIHPAQVAIVNEVYTPTAAEAAYATRVLHAWEDAQAAGRGVCTLDGAMIDAPLVEAQRRVLARARRADPQ
jgi:citrate lyase subunit beta/citryl-CoA lyase